MIKKVLVILLSIIAVSNLVAPIEFGLNDVCGPLTRGGTDPNDPEDFDFQNAHPIEKVCGMAICSLLERVAA